MAEKTVTRATLQNYTPKEFGIFWPTMKNDLLIKLDTATSDAKARGLVSGIMISPASGAIGRAIGNGFSYHLPDMLGEIRAIDVMPYIRINNVNQSLTATNLRQLYDVFVRAGLTGIGVYPDWTPFKGFHVDVRPTKLATWAGVDKNGKQVYVSINEGFR